MIEVNYLFPVPVSLSLQINKSCLLLGLDAFNRGLLFQIFHVFLHNVHLLLEGRKKIVFVFIHDLLDELASVLNFETSKR